MNEAAFTPAAEETEIDVAKGCASEVNDERGRMGNLTLTNDRLLFAPTGPVSGNLIGDLVGSALRPYSGGPRVLLTIAEVRSGGTRKRRLLPDLYEFTQADGATCRLPMKQGRKWEALVRRLLAERHGLAVTDDGDGWTAR
jgi:hypothetical protein